MQPPEGLRLRLNDNTEVRVDEFVHAEEQNSSGPLRARLRGASLVFAPAPAPAEPSPAVLRRRQYLQRRADHRAYDKLVSNVTQKPIPPEERVGASLRHQFSISANMVVAPVGAGVVGYRLSKEIVPDKYRVVVGLLVGIAFLFIEMILHLIRSYSVEAALARKRRKANAMFGAPMTPLVGELGELKKK
mmetsp:Transcript_18141/g.53933  ORF Transcript_18141/g.53933 Transcript_18141/m.53933 type:complete len:189 (-) Transcript_18141:15-581(-)